MQRYCRAARVLGIVLVLSALARAQGILGPEAGAAAGGPIGLIIGILATVFEVLFSGGGATAAQLAQIANGINQSAQMLLGVADKLYEFLKSFIQKLIQGLLFLWNEFFRKLLQKLIAALRSVVQWLEDHLKSLVAFLKQVRAYLDKYFNTYLRPMLLLIQHIRQYLVLLSFLHIRIAQQLDQFLAQLQARIVQSFATMIATVNTLIDISNALADPKYLLRHPILLISIRRQIPALLHALTGRPPGYWFPSPRGAAGGPFAPVLPAFDFADPAQNPPTSSYISEDDGVGDLSGYLDGFQFTNGAVDQVAVLDYFNDGLWSEPVCSDPAQCLLTALNAVAANSAG